MPGVPKEFAEHKLHVREDAKPVKQPLRRLSEEKHRIVGEEIARLLAAGFIMEVFFPEWLASGRGVYHLVNPRQGKGIFGARLVEARVVYTHAPLVVLLQYKDWVGIAPD